MDKKRKYEVVGYDYVEAEVQRVSRTWAAKIPATWQEGTRVIIIKDGEIVKFEKVEEE